MANDRRVDEPAGSAAASSRDRLIAAAQQLYWEQGVSSTTPRQVMQVSGVGQGSLYHHFPAKHELAQAAIAVTVADALATAEGELTSGSPARERLIQYLTRPRDALAGCRVGRLTYEQYVIDDDALNEPVRQYFRRLIALVQDVFAELPGMDEGGSRRRAYAAVALIQGGYVLSRALDEPAALDSAVSGFVDVLNGDAGLP
ncbi:TetR/AcrR family transcriptional regulator [Phytoactinopolyspora alkaliphila]|uniref:TetR/AcrR family transcriptional regulator n=1 Tax=Phytoactinopolyspora alkaliphila TaxID=1783498 RepID=A0A6N9YMP0_9ACTN|nr:TetR/AcrR family transcriptional regulator [Phytoactinopolyspora alkaliphila]NED96215.1 TetR/AcrR family transcriptional regulator [Phytoactinopolyspora alkaliphila]